MANFEETYRAVAARIIDNGIPCMDRTGIGTHSLFGETIEHNMAEGFPLLTCKEVNFSAVAAELAGFLGACTGADEFREHGTKIWDANANDNSDWLANPFRAGADHLGKIYGYQWRKWDSYKTLNGTDLNLSGRITYLLSLGYHLLPGENSYVFHKHIDQIAELVAGLKANPFGRRHIVTAWNPGDMVEMALPPCHSLFQCYVSTHAATGQQVLSLQMYQRSADWFLGVPFNVASYALLLTALADVVGMIPGKLRLVFGDAHVYDNHAEAVDRMLSNSPVDTLPCLVRKHELVTIDDFKASTYDVLGYINAGKIPATMAV